jgi:hypothetical protein
MAPTPSVTSFTPRACSSRIPPTFPKDFGQQLVVPLTPEEGAAAEASALPVADLGEETKARVIAAIDRSQDLLEPQMLSDLEVEYTAAMASEHDEDKEHPQDWLAALPHQGAAAPLLSTKMRACACP